VADEFVGRLMDAASCSAIGLVTRPKMRVWHDDKRRILCQFWIHRV